MRDFIQTVKSEKEDQDSDNVIYKINYYPADYTLQVLCDKWENKEIQMEGFQRKYIWTELQRCRLIESFLLGLPVPGIFLFREPSSQNLVVIDGQQRLKTIFSYFENNHYDTGKAFELKNVREKWEGKLFKDLDRVDQIRLRDSILRAIIVEQIDPKDNTSISHIFERLNTGGTSLKLQEVRNCVYQGKFNDLLIELNKYEKWRLIIGLPNEDKRMRDVELILRFLALFYELDSYKKPMKDFLSTFMAKYKNDSKKLNEFEQIFKKTVDKIHTHLGAKAFRIKKGSSLNAAILDSVMSAFASNVDSVSSNIKHLYDKLLTNQQFIDRVSVGTTDETLVEERITLAKKELFSE